MWQMKGIAENITAPIIAPYSQKKKFVRWFRRKSICELKQVREHGLFAGISSLPQIDAAFPVIYRLPPDKLAEIQDGDILRLCPDGTVQRVFECASEQNVLFLTERCSSSCIMCPQPQAPHDYTDDVLTILKCIAKHKLRKICLSGGEPTLGIKLFDILDRLKTFPYAEPIMLTNGRRFADRRFTAAFLDKAPYNMVYAVPLYSPIPSLHDEITGVRGAFRETAAGIYHLTRYRVPIEIRVVLMKQNSFQLAELARYIGWNFPMAVHVAFMGMEAYGRAADNIGKIWIEPSEYMDSLTKAVRILAQRRISVSIYNLPLCLLTDELKPYHKKAISAWKQGYAKECGGCAAKDRCGGFFSTSVQIPEGLHPLGSWKRGPSID